MGVEPVGLGTHFQEGRAVKAVARIAKPVYRSKLEERFALFLEARCRANKIHSWSYEPLRLRIGTRAFYKPDFMVIGNDGAVTFYETKGRWLEAAKVRIRSAALQHPWASFIAVYEDGREENFSA